MSRFRNLPIRRKLTIITMLSSFLALLLACLGFVTYEQMTFRGSMVSDLSSTARMIGDNSAAALSFNDPDSAEQTLRSLSAHPHIVGGAIYDSEGKLFAQYRRAGLSGDFAPPGVSPDGHRFGDNRLELFQRIELAGDTAGVVYIQSDLDELRTRLGRYALIVLLVLAASLLLVFVLSTTLQRIISEPISHLAGIAGTVATSRDYSIRATKQSEDELGTLIDGFNEMLAQIQARDANLQQAQDLLEKRVEERTAELRSEVAERQRSEEALRETNQRFEIVTRATTDVIWDWNLESNEIWWNENYQSVFGYPQVEVGLNAESWKSRIHPEDRPLILQSVHEAINAGQQLWSGEYRFHRHDGSYASVFDRGYVLHDEDGKPVRMIGAMQDITERKLAEAELTRTNRELLDVSRRAGMAEVATGVLHNVGNVLNSVNVSATLMGDRLRKSKTGGFTKVATLLKEQAADLPGFFTRDARAAQLPGYLEQFAGYLAGEQQALLGEVDNLRQNIEHIKDIVAMQQSYAKVSGLTEMIAPAELFEDALRLNANSMDRHAIAVVKELEALPPLAVDKHKVLQILVNFLRNAKHACDDAGRPDKRITLRLGQAEGRVQFAVTDNGVGIPAENLDRIFNHGFTTRQNGHGFGLHSGANAAREMGGAVTVHSDGPGHGATFTLTLPAASQSQPIAPEVCESLNVHASVNNSNQPHQRTAGLNSSATRQSSQAAAQLFATQ